MNQAGCSAEDVQDQLQAEYKLRDQITKESAEAFATEAKAKMAFDGASTDVEKYLGLARRAVRTGTDDDARMFIRKMLDVKESIPYKEESYLAAKEIADRLRELGTKVHRDIKTLQQKKSELLQANGFEPQIPDTAGCSNTMEDQEDPVEAELHRLKIETLIIPN